MLTVDEYLEMVLSMARPLPAERTGLASGYGQVLAEDVTALLAVPPFTNSAMDGFAVRSVDTENGSDQTFLSVVGDQAAGVAGGSDVGPGQAVRIMTGAPMPRGADAVVAVEDTDQAPGDQPLPAKVRVPCTPAGKNVRHVGEDVSPGDLVLRAGTIWSPVAAASAASVGHSSVLLRGRPKVAVISTGSELVAAGENLLPGQIPDSNSLLLAGIAEDFGAQVVMVRTVSDSASDFEDALADAVELCCDLVVTTGAVSAGAFEVVRQTLEGHAEFVKVAMQPGKPQACGRINVNGRDIAFLGLPGNPVGMFVSSWAFLRPLIGAFCGRSTQWPSIVAPALDGWKSPASRRQLVPVVVTSEGVRRTHRLGSGSHLVASLHLAQALAVVPADQTVVEPGDLLEVRMLNSPCAPLEATSFHVHPSAMVQ